MSGMSAAAILARVKRLEALNPVELMINAIDDQGREVVISARDIFDADGRLINGFVGVSIPIVASGSNVRILDRVLKSMMREAIKVGEEYES